MNADLNLHGAGTGTGTGTGTGDGLNLDEVRGFLITVDGRGPNPIVYI